jgi:hypothetical protein
LGSSTSPPRKLPTRRPFPPERLASAPPPFRTFFAIALQIARAFPAVVALVASTYDGDRLAARRAARQLADAILDGARDRGTGPLVRSLVDQQRRTEPLRAMRPRRVGRTSQAHIARRRRTKGKR